MVPELLLAHGTDGIDLVAEDQERDLGKLFYGEQRVKLSFGFCKPFVVGRVDQKDDAVHLGKVVSPETTGFSYAPSTFGESGVKWRYIPCWCPPRS